MILGKLMLQPEQSGNTDGKYQLLVKTNGFPAVSQDYGLTWSEKAVYGGWYGAAVSDTGQHQVVSGQSLNIYVSNDFGNTWNARYNVSSFRRARVSSSGQFMIVSDVNSNLYYSSDYGLTWGLLASYKGIDLDMSWDGRYIVAHGPYATSVNVSSDFGQTWVNKPLSGVYELRGNPSMSKDGRYQIAGGLETYVYRTVTYRRARVWKSSDYGVTWTLDTSVTPGMNSYPYPCYTAMSGDGRYWTASYVSTAVTRISSNYGATWGALPTSGANMAISHDGKYMLASQSDQVLRSVDYGNSFMDANPLYTYALPMAINKYS